jgi:hypothetical protein
MGVGRGGECSRFVALNAFPEVLPPVYEIAARIHEPILAFARMVGVATIEDDPDGNRFRPANALPPFRSGSSSETWR